VLDRLREALEKALHLLSQESRAKPGKRRPRKKPGKAGRVNKFKNAPGSACGTGAGGFKAGNNCQKEDGIPNLPKAFSQGGKSAKAASLPATKEALAAKAGILKQATKQAKIRAARKKAAIRKKEKDAKAAEENKARAEAAAKKRAEMLKVIRKKKANEKLQIVGDKSVDVNQIKVNKANQGIKVVGTPKSLAQEIAEAKAAAAAKTAEKGKPAPYKKPDTPPPPEPPASTPNPKDLTKIKALGGSTGATLAKDAAGNEYVIKGGKSAAHIKSESDADELYRAAGVNVPKQQVHDTPDGPQKVAEFIKGKTLDELKTSNPKQYEAAVKRLRKDFVVDALLGNRDVVGMKLDNIVVGKGGKVFRVDNGGSLTFRAQGATKDFGPDVSKELNGLRDSSINPSAASVFGGITNKEVSSQITVLMKKKEAILAAAKTPELRDALAKRLDSLTEWQKSYKKSLKSKPVASKSYQAANGAGLKKAMDAAEGAAPAVQNAVASGKTSSTMSESERDAAVAAVWNHSLTKAERQAATDYGKNGYVHILSVEKQGAAAIAKDQKSKNFAKAVEKLPKYEGQVTRRLDGIKSPQIKGWLKSGRWSTEHPGHEGNPTHASFSTIDKAADIEKSIKNGSAYPKGNVVVVIRNNTRAADTGKRLPHNGEKEVFVPPSLPSGYKVSDHYWILDKSHPAVKSGKASKGDRIRDDDLTKMMGGSWDQSNNDGASFVLVVDEDAAVAVGKKKPKKRKA
jgi:hypothetical protein